MMPSGNRKMSLHTSFCCLSSFVLPLGDIGRLCSVIIALRDIFYSSFHFNVVYFLVLCMYLMYLKIEYH